VTLPVYFYFVALSAAFFVTLIAIPIWTRWCLKIGLIDEPGKRKIHQTPIPLAGGLGVLTGILVPIMLVALALRLSPQHFSTSGLPLLEHGFNRRSLELFGILLGMIGVVVLGCVDDKYELNAIIKFLGQFIIAFIVAACGLRISMFVPNLLFNYGITILWIITVINAFNFMDNMNGLCSGLGALGALYFAIIAGIDGQYLVALMAFLVFGALVGFLPYNFPRAKAFLGDAGSHLVGYALAVLAILPHFYNKRHPRQFAILIPLLVLAVPLVDLVWVVVLRSYLRKPFYIGDNNHLSHRLVRLGLKNVQAVMLIWLLAAAIGMFAFLL
jgi:UDP-GlcNAc:undecaprenyl-phosphate GlcNAc-1-phosphate transferase